MSTIGVHTHITNPLTSGYLSYLASIESWARIADQVIVVDGGSVDNSIDVLREWLGPLSSKVTVVAIPETEWGKEDSWEWPQLAVNRQVGYSLLDTDWAIHIDADHVLCDGTSKENVLFELSKHPEALLLNYWVSAFSYGSLGKRIRKRPWIINKKLALQKGIDVAYGVGGRTVAVVERPIFPRSVGSFVDPLSLQNKQYFIGDLIEPDGTVNMDCVRYGHFFFTAQQCLHKSKRLDKAYSRFAKKSHSRDLELILKHALPRNGKGFHFAKDELLLQDHPSSIKRVFESYYSEDMLGAFSAKQTRLEGRISDLMLRLLSFEHSLRNLIFRLRLSGSRRDLSLQNRL